MKYQITLNCGCVVELDICIKRDDAFIPIPDLSDGNLVKTCYLHTPHSYPIGV